MGHGGEIRGQWDHGDGRCRKTQVVTWGHPQGGGDSELVQRTLALRDVIQIQARPWWCVLRSMLEHVILIPCMTAKCLKHKLFSSCSERHHPF